MWRGLGIVAALAAACSGPPTTSVVDADTTVDSAPPPDVFVPPPDAPPACGTPETPPCVSFADVTVDAELTGALGPSPLGDVIAFADVDGDDDMDIARSGRDGISLWRNRDDGGFDLATSAVNLDGVGATNAIVPADVDGDGDNDLLLLGYGAGSIQVWTGGGYAELAGALPASVDVSRATTGALADCDLDGDLDLFIARDPTYASAGYLLANDGTGMFTDITAGSGLDQPGTLTFQALWFDYDGDGDPDLALSNDRGNVNGYPTQLFRNDGNCKLTEVTAAANLVETIDGMGLVAGDIDGDGDPDLYASNTPDIPEEGVGHLFYRNNGDGTFTEISAELGVQAMVLGWGVAMPDIDNDGDLDLLAAADGHATPPGTRLFENLGGGRFRDITEIAGLTDDGDAYGVSIADYDGDGFVDIALAHTLYGAPVGLWRNSGSVHSWLKVRLRGQSPNTYGVGAKVTAVVDGVRTVRWVDAGSGFGGANPAELIIGLGGAHSVDELRVDWPSGAVTIETDIDVRTIIDVVEQ